MHTFEEQINKIKNYQKSTLKDLINISNTQEKINLKILQKCQYKLSRLENTKKELQRNINSYCFGYFQSYAIVN